MIEDQRIVQVYFSTYGISDNDTRIMLTLIKEQERSRFDSVIAFYGLLVCLEK